ncbi:hypothetical protein EVAR_74075_1 [Eumeta japonica]|uniref:Uncharacterized protein n=1 Tax=Eumeta variegata TaxID=151549 RepID=A0A4C1TEE0_EUMVA|nr:hypothetical protein EVAR_74075_1 [Eumeta japonica]
MRVVYLLQASASISNEQCPIFQLKRERDKDTQSATAVGPVEREQPSPVREPHLRAGVPGRGLHACAFGVLVEEQH